MKPLEGRIAIVTGVGRRHGIGFAVCTELAKQGSDIVYTHWNVYDKERGLVGSEENPETFKKDFEVYGTRIASIAMNLRTAEAPAELFTFTQDSLGIPTILI